MRIPVPLSVRTYGEMTLAEPHRSHSSSPGTSWTCPSGKRQEFHGSIPIDSGKAVGNRNSDGFTSGYVKYAVPVAVHYYAGRRNSRRSARASSSGSRINLLL